MTHFVRRAGLLAAPALLISALATVTGPASATAPSATDPAPAAAGSTWLAAQLNEGLVHNDQFDFDDIGLSIDVAFALDRVGGHDADVQSVADAVAANLETYSSYPVGAPGSGKTHIVAGSLAKALALAQAAGRDGTTFGGTNLVTDVEARVATDGNIAGRLQDVFYPEEQFESDFANVIAQSYAVQALDEVNSTRTDAVTDFLLAQQCADGYFRLNFADAAAPSQTCDGDPNSAPDVDATAIAVGSLASQLDDSGVSAAVTKSIDWLKSVQHADGSFGGGTATEAPNANSTGLAGLVLAESGSTAGATKAAVWIRQHQLANPGQCAAFDPAAVGAVAYDDAARTAALTDGITVITTDQFRRASAQALPLLQWAPAASGDLKLKSDGRPFWKAGSGARLTLAAADPGDTVCMSVKSTHQRVTTDANGAAALRLKLPNGTADRQVTAAGSGSNAHLTLHVLDELTIPFSLSRQSVSSGQRQVVKVRGLAAHEVVLVRFRGQRAAQGQADKAGTFRAAFTVTGKPGNAAIQVSGYFASIRTNTKTFKVTR